MKKMSFFVVFIFTFCSFLSSISASQVVRITGVDVRIRSSNTTNSSILKVTKYNDEYTLINANAGTGTGCSSLWYKIRYDNNIGYVCSDWAVIITKDDKVEEDYSKHLSNIGFPDSYIPYLVSLHNKYPNWKFEVFNSEISFDKIVNIEYDGYYKGWSLIEDTGSYYDGYKSTDSWSYNYLTNVFSTKFNGGGDVWYAANKQTISYYMDPRNFLNEKQIFMFETLSYNSNYHTKDGVQAMLKGTFMEQGYADSDNKKTFADAFIDASIKYDVSPYVLVARVIQEVGTTRSTIVSGTVSGYEGYYNFYNIEAAGKNKNETITNGLKYAKKMGWDNQYKAIVGGASFLSDGYISVGQDTLYLQKWDLFGPKYSAHQYMQNIQAPSTESIRTYNGYNNMNLLNNEFVFSIPVFENLPNKTSLPDKGNPNNYLSDLAVNGIYLFESATSKLEFDLNLDTSTSSVEILATKVSSRANVSGTGTVSLNKEKQTVDVVVTAENGDKRTYKINITRNADTELDIGEILRVLEIENDGTYIYGIKLGTNIKDIINKIKNKESRATVSYFDKDGKVKDTGVVASGDVLNIKTSKEEKKYTFIIRGDVNGDGKILANDYVMIKNHILNIKKLSDFELLCADANKDGRVYATDYVTIKNDILNIKKIVQ